MHYMLDTNIASHIIKGDEQVISYLLKLPMNSIVISIITEAEILYGLEKCGSLSLVRHVNEFLKRVTTLEIDGQVAKFYSKLRVACESIGITLADLDMLIASHAIATNSVLVTNDKIFTKVVGLTVENWKHA